MQVKALRGSLRRALLAPGQAMRLRSLPPSRRLGLLSGIRERFNTKKKPTWGADNERASQEAEVKDTRPFLQRKWHKWSGALAAEQEVADTFLLEKFLGLSASLNNKDRDFPADHQLHGIAARARAIVGEQWAAAAEDPAVGLDQAARVSSVVRAVTAYLRSEQELHKPAIEGFLELVRDNAGERSGAWMWAGEAALRASVLQLYLARLLAAAGDDSLPIMALHDEQVLAELVGTFLLAPGAHRLEAHLALYGPELDQSQLQDAFYAFSDPEVGAVSSAMGVVHGLHKDHAKGLPKFASTYLLDVLELNVKSRCVFCWSDDAFSGIKPPDDDHRVPVGQLLAAREEYFDEGVDIGNTCASAYAAERRKHYHEKAETRAEAKKGLVFFLACCMVDTYVTYM